MTTATAPGKIILVGEHAVVYGRPAIAAPVWGLVATAHIQERGGERPDDRGCVIVARDVGLALSLREAPPDQPLACVARRTLQALALPPNPDWRIELTSQLPIAGGLGSGAALSAALVRAIFQHVGRSPTPEEVSTLVYVSEELYHGTPSGIDNTVVAYGQPIWFVRGQPPEVIRPGGAFTVAIAMSGIPSPTRETVAHVRSRWQQDRARYEGWFDAIGELAVSARRAIETGDVAALGPLFDCNQALLARLEVSSPPLERLIQAAREAGALGAKLSGGGRGGNIIALVEPDRVQAVEKALLAAGATQVVITTIGGPES